jgi:5-methylcytosine-specific restriction endonuclease McrA
MDEVWKGSKAQRATLRNKFNGRCGYCGESMVKMQADHIAPVTRLINDVGGNPLPASEQRMMNPERNVVGNMMPACPQCNNSKGGYSLEGWRDLLERSAEIVAREKPIFRAGVRMGVISVSDAPVIFYFERATS